MSELIWISDWQIQCCGSEFAIGDEVTWPVFPREEPNNHWGSAEITGTYDSHEDQPLPMMSGVVRRIRTASLRRLSDIEVIEDVTAIEKWYGIDFDPDVLRFCGWLVDLDVSS